MAKDKLILDIRYFESDVPNVDGTDPGEVGQILTLPDSSALTGARIARKLRELGFVTGAFNHVYINFSTAVPADEISFSSRSIDRYHPWYRYVDVGVIKSRVNRLSAKKMENWLESITLAVARFLTSRNKQQLAIVDRVRDLLAEHGAALPIIHKTKVTKTYAVTVSYQIAPQIGQSTAWIEYTNKKSGECRRGCFAKLEFYEDVLFLVSSIVVKSGTIVLNPRTSFKANLYNKRYTVPITIDIGELTIA